MTQGKSNIFINILIAVLLIGMGVLVYFYFQTDSTDDTSQQPPTALELNSQQIISLINRLERIKLDRGIVLREDFSSLRDITQPIPPQPSGVSNPFQSGRF